MDISKYMVVPSGRFEIDNIPTIKAYMPTPNEFDYKRGYIERYFLQKVNDSDSFIYEVDLPQYQNFLINSFYKSVRLKWKISGDADKARESNKASVRLVSSDMKSLILYLPNYLQFHQP
jgi:hypothetical protein